MKLFLTHFLFFRRKFFCLPPSLSLGKFKLKQEEEGERFFLSFRTAICELAKISAAVSTSGSAMHCRELVKEREIKWGGKFDERNFSPNFREAKDEK